MKSHLICIVTVIYKDSVDFVQNPTNFPDTTDSASKVVEVQEPYVRATIITPEGNQRKNTIPNRLFDFHCKEFLGDLMELCVSHRAEEMEHRYLDATKEFARLLLTCKLPLNEIVTDFFEKLKGRSSGFASFK